MDKPLIWDEAEKQCIDQGGHLASVHSAEENNFIRSLYTGSAWIGGSNFETEGKWVWSDGTEWDFEDWINGEPSGGPEHFLELRSKDPGNKYWNDKEGSYALQFFCKKSAL